MVATPTSARFATTRCIIFDRNPAPGQLTQPYGRAELLQARTPATIDRLHAGTRDEQPARRRGLTGRQARLRRRRRLERHHRLRSRQRHRTTDPEALTARLPRVATAGCATGRALSCVLNLFFSPNGEEHLRTAQTGGGAIAILNRNLATGVLSQEPGHRRLRNGERRRRCRERLRGRHSDQHGVPADGQLRRQASLRRRRRRRTPSRSFIRDEISGGLTQRQRHGGLHQPERLPRRIRRSTAAACSLRSPTPTASRRRRTGSTSTSSATTAPTDRSWSSNAAANGLLTFRSCVNEAGNDGCSDGQGVSSIQAGDISPRRQGVRGQELVGRRTGGVSFFDINAATEASRQRAGVDGCATRGGSARTASAERSPASAASSRRSAVKATSSSSATRS